MTSLSIEKLKKIAKRYDLKISNELKLDIIDKIGTHILGDCFQIAPEIKIDFYYPQEAIKLINGISKYETLQKNGKTVKEHIKEFNIDFKRFRINSKQEVLRTILIDFFNNLPPINNGNHSKKRENDNDTIEDQPTKKKKNSTFDHSFISGNSSSTLLSAPIPL